MHECTTLLYQYHITRTYCTNAVLSYTLCVEQKQLKQLRCHLWQTQVGPKNLVLEDPPHRKGQFYGGFVWKQIQMSQRWIQVQGQCAAAM